MVRVKVLPSATLPLAWAAMATVGVGGATVTSFYYWLVMGCDV